MSGRAFCWLDQKSWTCQSSFHLGWFFFGSFIWPGRFLIRVKIPQPGPAWPVFSWVDSVSRAFSWCELESWARTSRSTFHLVTKTDTARFYSIYGPFSLLPASPSFLSPMQIIWRAGTDPVPSWWPGEGLRWSKIRPPCGRAGRGEDGCSTILGRGALGYSLALSGL